VSNTQYPRLADPSDIPRLLSSVGVSHTWPPPGTTVNAYGYPETWVLVTGTAPGPDGYWYVTDLATVATSTNSTVEQLLVKFGRVFEGPIATLVQAAGQWPVIYEVGKSNAMRWIRCTLRGTIGGGVEQFQHKVDLGNPGSDPSTTEEEALLLATQIAGLWAANWIATPTGCTGSLAAQYPNTVAYTEVGVNLYTQTEGTDSSGDGGNMSQDYDTAWYMYPVGSRPVGTTSLPSLPWEVACAVTFQTDHRGQSGRGRWYLPPPVTDAMGPGGVWLTEYSKRAGKCTGEFFQDIVDNTALEPVVVSRRRIILNTIKTINVGTVPDSQRRRRNAQDEARVTQYTMTGV